MLLTFLSHQWTGFWRSRGKGGTIAAQLVMGFLILYIIGVAILVGYSMNSLIEHFLPGKDIIEVFNGVILYYFAIDFLMRIQLQELPTLAVVPYLHLNIPKRKLVSFLNIRALFSAFNILPLLLFFPFCIIEIGLSFGSSASMMYIVTIFALMVFNNYAALYFKRLSIVNIWVVIVGGAFLATIGLLEYFKVYSITSLSNIVFQRIALQPATGFLFVALAIAMFIVNARYLRNNLYIEELKSGETKKSSTDYPFLDRFGDAGTLAALEIKLILRNKRSRSTAFKGLIFLFYGFLMYKQSSIDKNEFGLILFAALFMTGNLILVYGQFMFGWQSAEFDGLLANKVEIKTFFKAKFLLLTLSATALTLIVSLYGLISWKLVAIELAAYLYNVGVGTVVVLYFATRNAKSIDLSKGSNFNWQGVSATTMLLVLPTLLVPYIIYFPLSFFFHPYWGIAGLAIVGLAGILSRNFWLGFLVNEFNKRKYTIAAGFREKS